MKKTVVFIAVLLVFVCFALPLYAKRTGARLISFGYGTDIVLDSDGGDPAFIGEAIYDICYVGAYGTGGNVGFYYGGNIRLMLNRYFQGKVNTYNLSDFVGIRMTDIMGFGFVVPLGSSLDLVIGLGPSVSFHCYFQSEPLPYYMDMLFGVGARTDVVLKFTDSVFIKLATSICYHFYAEAVNLRTNSVYEGSYRHFGQPETALLFGFKY